MLWGPFPVRPLAMAAFLAGLALLIGLETPANAQRTGADVNADEIRQGAKKRLEVLAPGLGHAGR